jgi:hypothetical protein
MIVATRHPAVDLFTSPGRERGGGGSRVVGGERDAIEPPFVAARGVLDGPGGREPPSGRVRLRRLREDCLSSWAMNRLRRCDTGSESF